MPICIYCKELKEAEQFNDEHVIPVSFGTFEENNFVLHDTVCRKCNQYFGDDLELNLGRGTLEGLYRFTDGPIPLNRFKRINRKILHTKVAEEGHWEGALLELKVDPITRRFYVEPVNQVGFREWGSGRWRFFEIKALPQRYTLAQRGFRLTGNRSLKILYGPTYHDEKMTYELIRRAGFRLDQSRDEKIIFPYSGKNIAIETIANVDKTICRAIAKIAFNYLAFIYGNHVALSEDFNPIRRFIRYGTGDVRDFVNPQKERILNLQETRGKRLLDGHIITVETRVEGNNISSHCEAISQISLHNLISYQVTFCRCFSQITPFMLRGHVFDHRTRQIKEVSWLQQIKQN